ncbi:MAG: hypothetical protein ACOCNA_04590 [Prevotella pectinovora]
MNKIRKYLIHLLGGVTKEYCDRKIDYFTNVERVNAINLAVSEGALPSRGPNYKTTDYEK